MFRSVVPHMGSATATGAILVDLGSPSPGPAVGRPGRMRRHCRAPGTSVPFPTETPRQSFNATRNLDLHRVFLVLADQRARWALQRNDRSLRKKCLLHHHVCIEKTRKALGPNLQEREFTAAKQTLCRRALIDEFAGNARRVGALTRTGLVPGFNNSSSVQRTFVVILPLVRALR